MRQPEGYTKPEEEHLVCKLSSQDPGSKAGKFDIGSGKAYLFSQDVSDPGQGSSHYLDTSSVIDTGH